MPVCLSVHWWCRSVVTWGQRGGLGDPVHMKTQPLLTWNQGLKEALQSMHQTRGPALPESTAQKHRCVKGNSGMEHCRSHPERKEDRGQRGQERIWGMGGKMGTLEGRLGKRREGEGMEGRQGWGWGSRGKLGG